MKTDQKIEILKGCTNANAEAAGKIMMNDVMFDGSRAYITTDLRARIRRRMDEQGTNCNRLAKAIGLHYSALYSFLDGRRPIKFSKLEELFALLDL